MVGEFDDEHAEARYVASEINRLVDEGTPRDRIAVFYRMNAQSRVLEDTLVRFEIPYQVIGGTKFYERAEIKDAIAYLQLLANPADADLVRPDRQLAAARDRPADAGAAALAREHARRRRLGRALAPERDPGAGRRGAARRSAASPRRWPRLRQRAERRGPVAELLEAVLHETGYIEALEAERTVEAEGRIENLEELVGVAGEFDANREVEGEPEMSPLEEFLAQISLVSEQDNLRDDGEPRDADDRCTTPRASSTTPSS